MDDAQWYKDAVIYEVHVRSFFDSDGDGIGDLIGLTKRLDYIEELGVTALWILPFYPSPLRDDGYDIASYTEVHPDYGTLEDFRHLLREAHRRGLKVITELVLNHTSDQHPWFQRARQAPKGSPEREFYVWSDHDKGYSEARIIFSDVKTSNWTFDPVAGQYYWHRFYSHQPDLNFENPLVQKAIFDFVDFWMEMGIDGLRLDAVTYLYEREGTNCESLPETHQFLKDLRAHIDERYAHRMLLAEANQWPEKAIHFFGDGDECQMVFHFPLMPRLFMALEMEDRHPVVDILEQTPQLPEGAQWALFLRNHDELTLEMVTDEERDFMYRAFAPETRMRINLGIRRRLAPMLGGDRRKIQLLNALLLSLPGTPVLYYGDEIGMGDNYHLGDRDGVRTPMQWSPDRNGGFSRANPQSLFLPAITDPSYHYISVNVENQENNPSSLLNWLKRLIALRTSSLVFSRGDFEVLPCSNHRIFAFLRRYQNQEVLCLFNFSRSAHHFHLDLSEHLQRWPIELQGLSNFPPVVESTAARYPLALGPYGFFFLELAREPRQTSSLARRKAARRETPLEVEQTWTEVFDGRYRRSFFQCLRHFLSQQRWFNPRHRDLLTLDIEETIRLRWEGGVTLVAILEARFHDGESERYVLPLDFASDQREVMLRTGAKDAILTEVQLHQTQQRGVIYDATANPAFASALLNFIRKSWRIQGQHGVFQGHWEEHFADLAPEELEVLTAAPADLTGKHTTMVFGKKVVMKLFRRLEEGRSVDVEIGTYLASRDFQGATPLMGYLDYQQGRWEPTCLITLHQYLPHQCLAYDWFAAAASKAAKEKWDMPSTLPSLLSSTFLSYSPSFDSLDSDFQDQGLGWQKFWHESTQLGELIAEMHRHLAGAKDDTALAPIPLFSDYERARYQAMRSLLARTFRGLRRSLPEMGEHQQLARWILEQEGLIQAYFFRQIGTGDGGLRTRIHGDLHLKEVLKTDTGFRVIDFEGHPWLPIGERRIKRSPLRDVASMLHSFHHAALVIMTVGKEKEELPLQDYLQAHRFYLLAASGFLQGYFRDYDILSFLPTSAELSSRLLDSLRLKKALQQLNSALEKQEELSLVMICLATLIDQILIQPTS